MKIQRSKDIPWRIKCRRLVDHVYPVFSFGSETWSWTRQTRQKIQGWEKTIMTKLFCLKRQKEETWVDYQTRTSIVARKIWVKMKLPSLYVKNAEGMWRAMVWACNEKENAVIDSLKKVYKWRSMKWWYVLHTRMMKEDPENRTRWQHKWGWHNRGNDKTTRQQLQSKARSHLSYSTTTKVPCRFWRVKQLSERDGTLRCSADPEWYGCHGTFGTLASTCAPAARKKTGRSSGTVADLILNVVCTLKLFTPITKSYAPLRSVSLVAHEYSEESLISW